MAEAKSVDQIAMQRFVDAAILVSAHTHERNLAVQGNVQALCQQIVCQALIRLLIEKNIVSDSEMTRVIAREYDAARQRLVTNNMFVTPKGAIVRPQ